MPDKNLKNRDKLQRQYQAYFELITGQCELRESPLLPMVQLENKNALSIYQSDYLNDQILNWSGVIEEIFSKTCQILKEERFDLEEFLPFFHQTPLPLNARYDFFLIKLNRFKEFISEISKTFVPAKQEKLIAAVEQEYKACREAYLHFNPPD